MNFPSNFKKRFWDKVIKGPECWEWEASRSKAGYGQLQVRSISPRPLLAHRVSWILANGEIPNGLFVLHKCDNPACVRPSHLFLGTQRDNNTDRQRKGRTASGDCNGSRTQPERNSFVRNRGSGLFGEKHPGAKLSDAQVEELRREFEAGTNRESLARRFGISVTHVYRLGKGQGRKQ